MHDTLVKAYENLKTKSNIISPNYSREEKEAALKDAFLAAKNYVKAKLKEEPENAPNAPNAQNARNAQNTQNVKAVDWIPGSHAGRSRFNGTLTPLMHEVTKEMKKLGVEMSYEDSLIADQCEVRRAYNPKHKLSFAYRKEITECFAKKILNNQQNIGGHGEVLDDVYKKMVPDSNNHKTIRKLANLVIVKNGEKVYGKYKEKLVELQAERKSINAAKAKKNRANAKTTTTTVKKPKTNMKNG